MIELLVLAASLARWVYLIAMLLLVVAMLLYGANRVPRQDLWITIGFMVANAAVSQVWFPDPRSLWW
jgi:hypothetical protein